MGSLNIHIMREEYQGKSDTEAAKAFAQKHGYIAIVHYKNSKDASDFTDIGTCQSEEQIQGYLRSSYCHDVELIYDGRATALRITKELILRGHCELCDKKTTQDSLQLMAGNDFYICPKCGMMFCDVCYGRLPLTSSPGYGMCPKCRVKVQRAIIGHYGEQSGFTGWTCKGKTFEESIAGRFSELISAGLKGVVQVVDLADLIKENEMGTFTVVAFEGKPYLVAKIRQPKDNVPALISSIKAGRIILRTSFYPYPTYPIIYNRVFIVSGDGPRQGSYEGVLVESATNFTEANFQQWAITLRGTRRLCVHVYTETMEELASGEADITAEVTDMIIDAIDHANESLKAIPEEQQNFKEAVQAFFRDHPEPFLFDSKQQSVRHGKSTEENQNELRSNGPEPLKTSGLQANKVYDWSNIVSCQECGAGNPVNATECIKCKKKLSLREPDSAKSLTLTKEENAKIVSMLNHQFLKIPNIEKQVRLDLSSLEIEQFKNRIEPLIEPETKFLQWLYQHRLFLSVIFLFVLLLAVFIFRENLFKITIIALVIAGFIAFVSVIESEDIREAKRAERDAEQAKKDMRKKQTHLDMEVERITNVIRKKVEKNKPLENILPKVLSKDYEALAKTISTIDFIKDTDKGRLFKNMSPDFISKILACFSEADEITILRQIESEKRKDVLMRCSLSKRARLESAM